MAMAKFARLFESRDRKNQVSVEIIWNDEDERYELEFKTEVDEVTMAMSLGYETKDQAKSAFEKVTLVEVNSFRKQMVEMVTDKEDPAFSPFVELVFKESSEILEGNQANPWPDENHG